MSSAWGQSVKPSPMSQSLVRTMNSKWIQRAKLIQIEKQQLLLACVQTDSPRAGGRVRLRVSFFLPGGMTPSSLSFR